MSSPSPSPDAPRPSMPRSDALLAEIRLEFPSFEIVYKKGSSLQRTIAIALALVTLGGQRRYLTHYHTMLFGRLHVPDSWEAMSDEARYVLLRHELVHLRQRSRMGDVLMALSYLLLWFPVGLAWGRARLEWEAYAETLRATAELQGLDAARALEPWIVQRFVGPDYAWMWPFPGMVRRWFREVIADLAADARTASADVVKASGDGGRRD